MSRYIKGTDIEEQYQSLKAQKYGDVNATISKEEILNLTLMAIDSCPSADVVEVVRCKDCKHWSDYINEVDHTATCYVWSGHDRIQTNGKQWCCYGERKDK